MTLPRQKEFAAFLEALRVQRCNRVTGVAAISDFTSAPEVVVQTGYTATQSHDLSQEMPEAGAVDGPALEDRSLTTRLDEFIERAAICEFDGNLPRQIADGLARLCTMAPPQGFCAERWSDLVDAAGRLADEWGATALALGWTPARLFGLNSAATGYDEQGLAFVLDRSSRVVKMTSMRAVIEQANGTRTNYFRQKMADLVPAWRLADVIGGIGQ